MEASKKQSILVHERPITDLRFHPDGDVFFTASKDTSAAVIDINGKILGTLNNHMGAITAISPHENSLATAGADLMLIDWDVITGKAITTVETEGVVRGMEHTGQIYFGTDDSMSKMPFIGTMDPRTGVVDRINESVEPVARIFKAGECIVITTKTGKASKLDLRNGQIVQEEKLYQSRITDTKHSACRGFFIAASVDNTAKIVDTDTFATKKKFYSDEQINSVAIFSTNDKVVLVGGINARDVTVTQGKSSFDTNFYDIVTQQRIGSFTTHFGTINAVDVHPNSTHYISGGEDGSVSLVKLGDDFLSAPFTKLE